LKQKLKMWNKEYFENIYEMRNNVIKMNELDIKEMIFKLSRRFGRKECYNKNFENLQEVRNQLIKKNLG